MHYMIHNGHLRDSLNSSNHIIVIIFIVILLVLLLFCSPTGVYTFNIAIAYPVGLGLYPQSFTELWESQMPCHIRFFFQHCPVPSIALHSAQTWWMIVKSYWTHILYLSYKLQLIFKKRLMAALVWRIR